MAISNELIAEAKAFDARIRERVRNGHVPDLRGVQPCDFFYNNPWRRPEYVDMVFGEYFRFALEHLEKRGSRVLEVGCGPGHMVLELARHGHQATGLDLSPACIDVAKQLSEEHSCSEAFGSTEYVCDDFLSWVPQQQYDAVCFFLSLHHFADPDAILAKTASLLNPGGVVIAIEPARDLFSPLNATIAALIRLLLSQTGGWYERLELPKTELELERYVQDCLIEYREARDRTEGLQSPKDNSSFAEEMLAALRTYFDEIAFGPGYALLPRLVGGVRGATEQTTMQLAQFLQLFDDFCVRRGHLHPGAFYFAGKVRNHVQDNRN